MQFVQVLDHGDKDDVAEGDKIDGCKILKQIAAHVDIDLEEDDKSEHIPKQFEGQENNFNNGKNSPLIGVPQQNYQHPHMIHKSKQGRKTLNFKPGSKCNFHVVGPDIAALGVVVVGEEEADDPRKGYVPVECVFEVDEVVLPVRLGEVVDLGGNWRVFVG